MKSLANLLILFLLNITWPVYSQGNIDATLFWEGNSLVLKNASGKVVSEYSSKLGKPDCWVDARPQKIMLFFKSYQRIEFLDHKLNRIGDAIFLPDVGVYKSHLACPSTENGLWVYDESERKIHFVDFKLRKKTSSLELTSILSTIKGHPTEMKEIGGRLYLIYPQLSLVIDRYGNLIKVIQNKN